jgi:hypothetical protein
VKADDPDMADVIFLDKHPGWSWTDLMAAPDHIVAGMRELDRAKAAHG